MGGAGAECVGLAGREIAIRLGWAKSNRREPLLLFRLACALLARHISNSKSSERVFSFKGSDQHHFKFECMCSDLYSRVNFEKCHRYVISERCWSHASRALVSIFVISEKRYAQGPERVTRTYHTKLDSVKTTHYSHVLPLCVLALVLYR